MLMATETQTHKPQIIKPRASQRCTVDAQTKTHPDRVKSGKPRPDKSCTNADGLKLPAFRPGPVVYRAIAPAFENCMRSYRPLRDSPS